MTNTDEYKKILYSLLTPSPGIVCLIASLTRIFRSRTSHWPSHSWFITGWWIVGGLWYIHGTISTKKLLKELWPMLEESEVRFKKEGKWEEEQAEENIKKMRKQTLLTRFIGITVSLFVILTIFSPV